MRADNLQLPLTSDIHGRDSRVNTSGLSANPSLLLRRKAHYFISDLGRRTDHAGSTPFSADLSACRADTLMDNLLCTTEFAPVACRPLSSTASYLMTELREIHLQNNMAHIFSLAFISNEGDRMLSFCWTFL